MEKKFDFPTEVVELPSKGLLYPENSPLSSGTIEMKYMTAKEDDILTNINYLQQGVVIDKLLQSLIVSDVNYDDLLLGDKNALLIAARVFISDTVCAVPKVFMSATASAVPSLPISVDLEATVVTSVALGTNL